MSFFQNFIHHHISPNQLFSLFISKLIYPCNVGGGDGYPFSFARTDNLSKPIFVLKFVKWYDHCLRGGGHRSCIISVIYMFLYWVKIHVHVQNVFKVIAFTLIRYFLFDKERRGLHHTSAQQSKKF